MTLKMVLRTLIICCYLYFITSSASRTPITDKCLTGYMTDRQSWVDRMGVLKVRRRESNYSVDLSFTRNPVSLLRQKIEELWSNEKQFEIKYLSFSNCALIRIPLIFQMVVSTEHVLSETLQYMTFYGNNFASLQVKEFDEFFNATNKLARDEVIEDTEAASMWSSSLQHANFPLLKELDLRACSIQVLGSYIFQGMPNLEALYLGENQILHINPKAFVGMQNLIHLDISRNNPRDVNGQPQNLLTDSFLVLENLVNLESLDLSHSKITPRNHSMVMGSLKKLRSLSLCNTNLTPLNPIIFSETSLEILDISNNEQILDTPGVLQGLEKKLRVLYASDIHLKSIDIFKGFNKLEILQLSKNDISFIPADVVLSLENLQILDLNENKLTTWSNSTFSLLPKLRLLSLRSNNINMISHIIIDDLKNIDYLALANNFIVCYCEAKDFFDMAAINENKFYDTKIRKRSRRDRLYHIGYDYYNRMIFERKPIAYVPEVDIEDSGRCRLIDYEAGVFTCLQVPDGITVSFFDVNNCYRSKRDVQNISRDLSTTRNLMFILLLIPFILIPMLLLFVFRRNLKYFLIAMRNSAVLSSINKNTTFDDGTIYNYDVFVSYCNEDRGWVLNHLLPHMEAESNISACLHERDFQVGLSILENIVLCMDRSRYILLVLSQRFLISRWCQFEMHLAQHRLLETRREDLILVLLEDIPRRMRPNTLHYLMLTKTYIVWPKEKSERILFWKRLKKSLLSQKTKVTQNVSLA